MIELYFSRRFKKQYKNFYNQSLLKKIIFLFQKDIHHPSLHYKKIKCSKNKNLYSIRVDKNYRILMTLEEENYYFLICLCDHDEYDRITKDC